MDDVIKRMEGEMLGTAIPQPFAGKGARPTLPTRDKAPAGAPDDTVVELGQALGNLPARTMIAFRDAARDTNAITEWERCEVALHAVLGEP